MVTRQERVVLTLEDHFSREITQAAIATKAFESSLRDLDGTSTRTKGSLTGLEKPVSNVDKQSRLADRSINQLTGRLRLLTDVALTLGPALVPLGAAGVGAVAALAAQFGALAGGIGVSVVALKGVGDGLKAVNTYQLEPTAENLAAVAEEFEKLGPAGAEFVVFLESITPQLREMQMLAREGILPGLAEGIESFLARGSQLNNIIGDLSASVGDLSAAAGEALGGSRFDAFFDYLDREAGPLLLEFGRSLGYVAEGLANLLVAFAPLSSDFSSGLEGMARSFAEWSRSLDDNQSFQEFLAYLRESGPAALDFLASLVKALASVVEAAAPVGQAVLPALTKLLDVFAAIAGTPIGSTLLAAAAGFIAVNRATAVLTPALGKVGDALFLTDRAFTDAGRSAERSRTSMLSMGRSLGVVAAAMVTLESGSNIFDSLSRSFAAGDEAAASLTELEDRLRDSNLGKFAADLGIDVQRLAQDMAVSGTEGEYYREVLEKLGSATDGFGGKVNAVVDTIGFWTGDTEQARLANLDLGKIVRGNTGLLGSLAAATIEGSDAQLQLAADTDEAAGAVDRLQNRLKAARQELKQSRQDARGVAESFVGLGDSLNDSEVSLQGWLAELERNAEALRRFQENAERAARRGLDEGLVESLRAAGSEGALRMRQLANGTEEEIARANKAWRTGQGAVKDFVDEVGGVKPAYVTRLEARVEEALADLARLRAQLNIPDEYVNVWVTRRDANATPGFGPVGSADGGTVPKTGRGYADRHLYMLADGEEVISNRRGQADRHRALLKAINAGRLADGGTAWGGTQMHIPRNIRQSLSLDADMSAAQIRQEYREFRRVLREAGIELPKNFDKMREKSLELAERFDKVSKRIEKTERALEKWREIAEQVNTSVRSIFNNNIYGLEGGGLANAMLQLEADRNDTQERDKLLQGVAAIAQSLGLDLSSEAFQSIATGADVQTLRDLDTGGEVAAFFDLFNSRLQAQTAAGDFAATAVTGAQIEALETTLANQNSVLDNLTKQMERQEAQLERAATKGTQDGARAGVRDGLRDEERVKNAKAKTR